MTRETPSRFSGRCACGRVAYECSSAPVSMVNCHCRDCQRAGGAAYAPSAVVSRAALRVTRGEPSWYAAAADSGNEVRRAFCGHCGSPLFAASSARPEFLVIRAGSLDDPSWFRAGADVWAESAQPWDLMDDATPRFAKSRVRS